MPNHVTHRLFVTSGDPEALSQFLVRDEGGLRLDFNKLIPLPQSLNVQDSVNGSDGYDALFGDWQHVPVFDEKRARVEFDRRETLISHLREHNPEALKLGQAYRDNLDAYGVRTWYHWRINNWGTKWNAHSLKIVEPGLGELVFDTAWSVPEPIFHALAAALPKHEIRIYSFDERWSFSAETIIRKGKAQVCVMYPSTPIFEKVYGSDW